METLRCHKCGKYLGKVEVTYASEMDCNLTQVTIPCPRCGELNGCSHRSDYRNPLPTIIFLMGRSIVGVMDDAAMVLGDFTQKIVVTRDQENLTPPTGVEVVKVTEFVAKITTRYHLVANGGTTEQLVGTIRALTEAEADFVVWEVLRDGKVKKLWERFPTD